MKKWLLVLLVIILGVVIASFAFIPSVIKLSRIEKVAANSEEVYRYFTDAQLRQKWLASSNAAPAAASITPACQAFVFKGDSFYVTAVHVPSVTVMIGNEKEKTSSKVLMIPAGNDSTIIIWEAEINAGSNPVGRIANYVKASAIKEHVTEILNVYSRFISVPQNVYNFPIVESKVVDTLLLTTRKIFPSNPSPAQIFAIADAQKKYAADNGAALTNAPMLNMTILDSSHFQCTVAQPVSKALPVSGDIYMSRMIPGKILVQTVNGGPETIKYAFSRLSDYFRQHRHVSPALPFESMITNRSTETDTSKWMTKIFYPIF
ncbi:MAG: hypothetical protein ABIX01_15080 [Chitinophagaceae bacterium]